MTGSDSAGEDDAVRRARAKAEAARRRRRAEVFGDALPDTTRDERDPGEGADGESAGDRWLKSQVPPHHGG